MMKDHILIDTKYQNRNIIGNSLVELCCKYVYINIF